MLDDSIKKKDTVIIDFGLKYTKVGFEGEPEPRKILPTPNLFNTSNFYENTIPKTNIMLYRKDFYDLKYQIEEFVEYIIDFVLQISPQQKEKYICLMLIDFNTKENFTQIYEYFASTILSYDVISIFRVISKNVFPIFVTGFASGLILNCGYAYSTITVVNQGVSIYSTDLSIGISLLEKKLKKLILEDKNGIKGIPEDNINHFSDKINQFIEDILIRTTVIVNKKVSNEIKEKENILQGQNDYTKINCYKDLPEFNLSFENRVSIGEELFDQEREINLAYEVLNILCNKVPCEIRKKICSNIVLSGGMTMLFGFFNRFNDEIKELVNLKEFKKLQFIKDAIKVHKIIFPRNSLTWIGASLIMNFEKLNFTGRQITKDDQNNLDQEVSNIFK